MVVLESLLSLSSYPIPKSVVLNIIEECRLYAYDELTIQIRASRDFKRAKAFVYLYLSTAPNVTQGGISYSFSTTEREVNKKLSSNLLNEIDESTDDKPTYGYKGSEL